MDSTSMMKMALVISLAVSPRIYPTGTRGHHQQKRAVCRQKHDHARSVSLCSDPTIQTQLSSTHLARHHWAAQILPYSFRLHIVSLMRPLVRQSALVATTIAARRPAIVVWLMSVLHFLDSAALVARFTTFPPTLHGMQSFHLVEIHATIHPVVGVMLMHIVRSSELPGTLLRC